jgi:GntR family transcriptional regulator
MIIDVPTEKIDIDRLENVPLTERARTAIMEAILEGRFSKRLPSEDQLAEMLNVSRTTIRTALQRLEQDGIITRKRAIGTTINAHLRPTTLALQRMVGFDGLLREKGYDVSVEVEWERSNPSAELAGVFDLDPERDSLTAKKSYFADGDLAIYIVDIVPWESMRSQEFDGEVPPSIFEFSDREWTRPVDHVVAEILPVIKGADTTKLRVKKGSPFTRLYERHYASGGDELAVSMVDIDNRFFHIEIFRRR